MRRLIRVLAVTGAVAALALLGVPAASAADGGYLRLAHLSPDTPTVDVSLDDVADPAGMITLHAMGYGTVTDYQQVPPGTYAISMRAAGADPNSPPVLSTTVQVAPNTARTVAAVGHFSDLHLKVFDDDLTMPSAGQARMRMVDAAAAASNLEWSVPGAEPPVTSRLAFGAAGPYVGLPGGRTTLRVTPAGGTPVDLPVTLAAGSVYSVLVLDRPEGGLMARTVLDAATMDMTFMPVGGVETGAGGTAEHTPVAPVALGVALAAAVALLATSGVGRRRGSAARS